MHFLFVIHSDSCTCTNKSSSADSWANLVNPFISRYQRQFDSPYSTPHHFASSSREVPHHDRTTSSGLSLNDNWVDIYIKTVHLRTESLKGLTTPMKKSFCIQKMLYMIWGASVIMGYECPTIWWWPSWPPMATIPANGISFMSSKDQMWSVLAFIAW